MRRLSRAALVKFPAPEPKNLFALAFAPEWVALAAVAMMSALWAPAIDFHLQIAWHDFGVLFTVLGCALALRLFGQSRGALIAEFLGLTLAMAMVFTVFAYLCMASSGPLADKQLLAIDKAIGFDWLAGWNWITAYPLLLRAANFLYVSLTWQALYLCLLLGLMARVRSMREIFWIIFASAMLTDIGAIFFPAYGPFETFGLSATQGEYLPDMKHLKAGGDLSFALSRMTGVVSFPSFHTVLALAYAYGFRKTGVIGYVIAALNALMLLTVPFIGGHYLIDMIAGAAVFLISLASVKTVPQIWRWLGMERAAIETEPAFGA